jgi:mannose-6-phosphate isomerase-like protein (cupin superfamily)
MLSLQSHERRSELWQPLADGLVAYTEDDVADWTKAELLPSSKVYLVRKGVRHRLINPTGNQITVIETIIGEYDEDDIVRYHDTYGRQ